MQRIHIDLLTESILNASLAPQNPSLACPRTLQKFGIFASFLSKGHLAKQEVFLDPRGGVC